MSFSVTVGTVFHKAKCDLQKWFYAVMLVSEKNPPLSSRALAILIGTTKDTAWLMADKIKKTDKELLNKILIAIHRSNT
jgi:hypothetical protein